MIEIKKVFLLSPFILFILAALLHFTYDFTNQLFVIGFISPINESIFEHTKLIFIPLLLFYSLYYVKNKNSLDQDKYWFSSLISLILGIILVPMIYYSYTESFAVSLLVVDILITYVVLFLSNLFFYNYYNFYNFTIKKEISTLFIILIFLFYIFASVHQINLPIFITN